MSELLAGRYEVIRPLGTGGMADVLLVRDTREDRECALKRLHLTDPEAVARLREEFAALARIDHPNIVRVYDYGTLEDGAPYFTMEYLKGKPLDEALSPGDVPGVLLALRDILAGLAALHSADSCTATSKPRTCWSWKERAEFASSTSDSPAA
jgi:serine/threonine-protein kinase